MYLGNGRGAWLAGCYVYVQQLCGQPGVPAARILRSTPLGHIPERLHKGNVRMFNMSCLNFVFRNKTKNTILFPSDLLMSRRSPLRVSI